MLALIKNNKDKLRTFFSIMLPIFITQMAIMGMNFFDTIMAGNAGATQLAGVAIGGNMWVPVFTGINGILTAMTPIIAHYRGSENLDEIPKAVNNGIYLAIVLALGVIALGYLVVPRFLAHLSLEPEVAYIAKHYLAALALGIPPFFVNVLCRSLVDTMGYTRVTMCMFLIMLPINVGFNYVFIFGKLGMPAMGGIGAGYGTAATYWIVLGIFATVINKLPLLKTMKVFQFRAIEIPRIVQQLKLGIPIGIAIFAETSIWGAVAFFIAELGTGVIAAHQVGLNFSSVLYMLPLSVSFAMTILVGVEVGAKRYANAEIFAKLGMGFTFTVACGGTALVFLLADKIAYMYGIRGDVLGLTVQVLSCVMMFQVMDAIGTPLQGILRGYKDVNFAFIATLICYWLVALPTGYLLDIWYQQGVLGYWYGLLLGVLLTGASNFYRYNKVRHNYRKNHF